MNGADRALPTVEQTHSVTPGPASINRRFAGGLPDDLRQGDLETEAVDLSKGIGSRPHSVVRPDRTDAERHARSDLAAGLDPRLPAMPGRP